jgi:hypothetical protein
MEPIDKELFSTFYPKVVTKFSKIWIEYPGSAKNLSSILGSKKQRIPDPYPQHRCMCSQETFLKYKAVEVFKDIYFKILLQAGTRLCGNTPFDALFHTDHSRIFSRIK